MTRASTAGLGAILMALVVGLAVWSASPRSILAQDDASTVEVASGPLGEPTLRLSGRNVSSQDAITLVGYLTAVAGLGPADLFTTDAHSLDTARFTYVGDVAIASSADRADVTSTVGSGTFRVYFDEDAGAAWDDGASFVDGELVAEYELDLRETLQRQAPGVGVAVGDGTMVQGTSESFALAGEQFRFGLLEIEQRLRYVGAPIPAADGSQSRTIVMTGSVNVTRREATLARVGGPEVVSSPVAQLDECAALEPWRSQTQEALAQAQGDGSAANVDAPIESMDEAATRQAAEAVTALAERQRGKDVPEGAEDANRLAVTALSTYARGLQAVADAAADQDADLLALGQIAVRDGGSLIERAQASIDALATECAASSETGS